MKKNNEDKIYLFEQMPIPKAVMKLGIPTVIGCLVMILYNLADTYFVGMLNNPIENAAVTLAAPVILAFNAVTNLFGTGCSSMVSRSLGVKDYETVKKTAAFGFYCTIIAGLLYSMVSVVFKSGLLNLLGAEEANIGKTSEYLFWTVTIGAVPSMLNVVMSNLVRAEGAAMNASIGVMSGCFLNIILDPVFILDSGLGMGAAGAGMATMISNCVACLYFFIYLFVKRGKTFVSISLKDFKPKKEIVKNVCYVGIPASIQNLLNVTGMTVLNNLMSPFGNEAVAAAGIAHKTTMIPMYISMGVGQGVLPLVGYNFSAKNGGRVKESILFTLKISTGFMLAATALFYIFAGNISGAFIDEPLTVEYGTAFMKGMSLAQPFLALDFLAVGVFQACGMGGRSFIFAIMRKVVLEIPALLILNRLFPMYGLAYAQLVAEVVLSVIASVVLLRIIKSTEEWNIEKHDSKMLTGSGSE